MLSTTSCFSLSQSTTNLLALSLTVLATLLDLAKWREYERDSRPLQGTLPIAIRLQ